MAADEPRRSGRATKGQHKNAEPEPPPKEVAQKDTTTKRKGAAKKGGKSKDVEQTPEEEQADESSEVIRCVCGHNVDDVDGMEFISCERCNVWQHSICVGIFTKEDEPENYFCEQCEPEAHQELVDAIARGEQIWLERQEEAKRRKKRPAKNNKRGRVSNIKPESTAAASSSPAPPTSQGSGTKRKFEEETPQASSEAGAQPSQEELKRASASRADKRRKSSTKASKDTQTALVEIEDLPNERRNVAQALVTLVVQGVKDQSKSGQYRIPDGETSDSLGRQHASRIEYELFMNHSEPGGNKTPKYGEQFRAILANFKKNPELLSRILHGSLTPAELSIMPSAEMASEELQKQRAILKEEAEKQSTMLKEDDGPRVRRTHKGEEYVDDSHVASTVDSVFTTQPVRQRDDEATDGAGDISTPAPTAGSPTAGDSSAADRRTSSQFDINNVWAKTQQTPDNEGRPSQPPRRTSSAPKQERTQTHDADVDRLLADDNDEYLPHDLDSSDPSIVWRGRIVQPGLADFIATGRFIAGNDFSQFIPWNKFLPEMLEIEGRIAKAKADDYLCGLQWSKKSDVTVHALTPYDNRTAFDGLFEYFSSRGKYAVANKGHGTSELVKDLYISPVAPGDVPPPHIPLLDHVALEFPVKERMLLVTYVVNKPASWDSMPEQDVTQTPSDYNVLPPHLRHSLSGPAGSPIAAQSPGFARAGAPFDQSQGGGQTFGPGGLPPNPYSPQQPQGMYGQPGQPQHHNGPPPLQVRLQQALGPYADAPVVARLVTASQGQMEDLMLRNMRDILEREPRARDDMVVFASLLPK